MKKKKKEVMRYLQTQPDSFVCPICGQLHSLNSDKVNVKTEKKSVTVKCNAMKFKIRFNEKKNSFEYYLKSLCPTLNGKGQKKFKKIHVKNMEIAFDSDQIVFSLKKKIKDNTEKCSKCDLKSTCCIQLFENSYCEEEKETFFILNMDSDKFAKTYFLIKKENEEKYCNENTI